ncbi:MAG: prolipoprotein diacylglyceryl transferase family protein, partial [Aristaeellaceae bacterium]
MPATPESRYIAGTLPWYSVLIVAGICAALLVASREEKRLGLPRDTTVDLALWAIPFGIVGARLYYVAFAW